MTVKRIVAGGVVAGMLTAAAEGAGFRAWGFWLFGVFIPVIII